jgi:hypothetical protein
MVSKKTRTRNDISQLNMTGDDAIVLGSNSCFALPAAVPNIPMMSEMRLVPHSCSLVQATANCADPILATPAGLQILGALEFRLQQLNLRLAHRIRCKQQNYCISSLSISAQHIGPPAALEKRKFPFGPST